MNAASLLLNLHRAGFTLSVEGDKLNVDGPLDRLTDTHKAMIREHKAKLIAYSMPSPTQAISRRMAALGLDMPTRMDFIEQFNERAGIAEYDGNLPRQQAERIALDGVLADINQLDVQPSRIQP